MQAEELVARLERVKKCGKGSWMARCPSHKDRSASLHVTEKPDGRILMHCHAGCSVQEVLGVLEMDLSELFPPRDSRGGPLSAPFPAQDLLAMCGFEATLIRVILLEAEKSGKFSKANRELLKRSAARILAAAEIARPVILHDRRSADRWKGVESGQKFVDDRRK